MGAEGTEILFLGLGQRNTQVGLCGASGVRPSQQLGWHQRYFASESLTLDVTLRTFVWMGCFNSLAMPGLSGACWDQLQCDA